MKTKIIILLSVLAVGLAGILLYESFNTEMSEAEIKVQLSDLKSEYQQIKGDLDFAIDELEVKNEEVVKQKAELESLMSKKNITEEELKKAKLIMKNLSEVILKDYKNRVILLNTEKEKLSQQVSVIKQQMEGWEQKFKEEKKYSKQKDEAIIRKDRIINKKNEQIYYASRLILSNFILTGVKVRNNGKEVQTDKASRVDRLKVSFDIVPNQLTETGKKLIYTIITKPSGGIVSFSNREPGIFVYQNKRMLYSDEMVFDYISGEEKTLEFAWDNDDFEKGNYTVEVYEKNKNEIVLVGKAIKTLR